MIRDILLGIQARARVRELERALHPFIAGSNCDPNAKKPWGSGKWRTVNVRQEDYQAARDAMGAGK